MALIELKNNFRHRDAKIRDPLILDILIEGKIIVEVKATEKDHPLKLLALESA